MNNYSAVEILLVEDNPRDADLALRAMRKHNMANKLHLVRDGAEALDFIFARGEYADRNTDHRLKVVLLDLKLPKVDGLEVLRQIKADEQARMIPVVVLTSSNDERDLVESYRLGVNSYITKPVDFDKFMGSVQELGLYWLLINRVPE